MTPPANEAAGRPASLGDPDHDDEGSSRMGVNTIQLYLSYNTKETNTTIGMPELMEVQRAKEKAAAAAALARRHRAAANFNRNNSAGGSTVESWDDSPPAARKASYGVSFAETSPEAAARASAIHFADPESAEFSQEMRRMQAEADERHFMELASKGMLSSVMSRMPERERLHLGEDVYAFVFACSFCSAPFWFAIYFIFTKYTIFFCMLLTGINRDGDYGGPKDWAVQAVKFLLIPVAIAMQEDLMTAYYNAANKIYDRTVTKGSTMFRNATFKKWVLANFLRCIDGILSLAVCFSIMLITNKILGVFLNFAALYFLQSIDDVFYELAQRGFFFDAMEDATELCKQITFSRRYAMYVRSETATDCDHGPGGDDDKPGDDAVACDSHRTASWNNFLMEIDSLLLFVTGTVCFVTYALVQYFIYSPLQDHNDHYPDSRNEWLELQAANATASF